MPLLLSQYVLRRLGVNLDMDTYTIQCKRLHPTKSEIIHQLKTNHVGIQLVSPRMWKTQDLR